MVKQELISVIMPVYNTDKYITEAINSVLNQTYDNFELIIVDDASTDNSAKIIESFNNYKIKYIRLSKNGGAANARNVGLDNSKGNVICFIDSDDIWDKEKLKKQYEFMKKKNVGFVYAKYKRLYENGKLREIKYKFLDYMVYSDLISNTEIGTSTVMIDTNIISKDDVKMKHLGTCEDTATWLRIAKIGYKAYIYNEILAIHRVRRGSLSYNKLKTAFNMIKIYRKQEKFSVINTVKLFIRYEKNALSKRM